MTELGAHLNRRGAESTRMRSGTIRLRSFVLLAGAVRASSLPSRVGRSVLDLPLTASLRLSDLWRRHGGAAVDIQYPEPRGREHRGIASVALD